MGRGNPVRFYHLRRLAAGLAVTATVFAGPLPFTANNAVSAPQPANDHYRPYRTTTTAPATARASIFDELAGIETPIPAWAFAVAQCETGLNAAHIGQASAAYGEGATFRGAFGFWTTANGSGTFEEYGGRDLTGTFWANETRLDEQLLIFYRIHETGYTHTNGRYVPPVGYGSNNCKRYAGPITWQIWP